MDLKSVITASRGDAPAELLLTNANIVNVFSGRVVNGSIAVKNGYIIGFGDYDSDRILDLKGRYVSPGFIDSHVHIESSMACITEFARTVVSCGTTTVVADPHEIANVLGARGIDYMLQSAKGQPMDCLFALPSCVPATNMETAGAKLDADDLSPFCSHPRIVALAEMMNYPGVIFTDEEVMAKIDMAKSHRLPMDGHAPGVSGRQLYAYTAAGIASDHECTRPREALEKLELGMRIMVREGTCARNLDDLFPIIDANTWPRMMWSTDDRHPHDLLHEGHVDAIIRKAVSKGLDPITAIRMGTLTPADYFGIKDAGAIAPGRKANMVVFSDLSDIRAEQVFFMGRSVAEYGKMCTEIKRPDPVAFPPSMKIDPRHLDFSIPAGGTRARAIRIIPDQVVTRCEIIEVTTTNGNVITDISNDILKLAVVERYTGKGQTGMGLVTGLGLKRGAIASSVSHDSHNIIVAGVTDADMKAAVEIVVNMGGGFVAVNEGCELAALPLPVAGLMSDKPMATIQQQMDRMIDAANGLGTTLSDPFMTIGFLALPVIPDLKLTDKGLVDVTRFQIVPIFV